MTAVSIEQLQARIKELEAELEKYKAAERATKTHLHRFDDLDFHAFSQQVPRHDFDLFNQIHSDDVQVFNPGAVEPSTTNITDHDADMTAMFNIYPDLKIASHPISFGQGDWTCALGIMDGTLTGTISGSDEKEAPPTGKHLQSMMATVAKWEGDRIVEEHLFWANDDMVKKVGAGS